MANDLTKHVLEVVSYGLALKERLAAGDPVLIDSENAKLKQMLWGDGAVRGHADYGDNVPRPVPYDSREFLGVRYALACWVDEIFISDQTCAWSEDWTTMTLESSIFGGSQERAWRFWSQAEMAEKRPGAEALEAYLWCVMLGFRGQPMVTVDPAQWVDRVRKRVLQARQQEARLPADLNMRTNVPALRGRDRFRTAARVLVMVGAVGLFALTAVIAKFLSTS